MVKGFKKDPWRTYVRHNRNAVTWQEIVSGILLCIGGVATGVLLALTLGNF